MYTIVVTKGIKLSHIIQLFHSLNAMIDERHELRTVGEFIAALNRKLNPNPSPKTPKILYVDYLRDHLPSAVGPCEVYISYEGTGLFCNTIDTLRHHFQRNPDIFVCIDNITHRAPSTGDETDSSLLVDRFEDDIKQIGHVVVVMSPWNNLRIFRHTAMLFEIYCAIKYGCKFEIALSETDRKELVTAVANGVFDEMVEGLVQINSLKGIAKEDISYDIANSSVSNAVRDCLIAQSTAGGGINQLF